jgi:hypothetical protein
MSPLGRGMKGSRSEAVPSVLLLPIPHMQPATCMHAFIHSQQAENLFSIRMLRISSVFSTCGKVARWQCTSTHARVMQTDAEQRLQSTPCRV